MAEADPMTQSPVLDALINRASMPPRLLNDKVPPRADIDKMLAAAMSAPDHGAVHPWRFHVIEGEARNRLGDLFAEVLLDNDPFAPTAAIEKAKARPLRAPVIITVCAKVDPSRAPKIPVVEQVVTAAAAMEHLVIAAQAMGYGAIILTGPNAHAGKVRAAFGLDREDELLGFVYIGCGDEPAPPKERPDARDYTNDWTG